VEISRKSWPLGWTPGDDMFQGRIEGLPVFENLTMEEEGVLTLTDGTKIVSNGPMVGGITNIYSKVFDLAQLYAPAGGWDQRAKVRYLSIYDPLGGANPGSIVRNYGPSFKQIDAFEMQILTGGSARSYFGFAKGWTLIHSGNQHLKDNGKVQFPLGLPRPAKAQAIASPAKVILFGNLLGGTFNNWDTLPLEGTGYVKSSDYVLIAAAASGRGVVQAGAAGGTTFVEDLTAFDTITKTHSEDDLFKMTVRISDTSKLVKIRIEILLDTPTAAPPPPPFAPVVAPDVKDYFWYEWTPNDPNVITGSPGNPDSLPNELTTEQIESMLNAFPPHDEIIGDFRTGINIWNDLQAKRSQFFRVGTDGTKGWHNVRGYKLIVVGAEGVEMLVNQLQFQGGIKSNLLGKYRTVQVNVHNAGTFFDKSPASEESDEVEVFGTSIRVTTNILPTNLGDEVWIYLGGGGLDGYYRAARLTVGAAAGATFDLQVTELDLRLENEKLDWYLENLPENIIAIVDDFFDRTLYFTPDSMYPSYTDNPGGYDARFVYKIASTTGEIILWAKKASDSLVLVGTTKEIYAITGDGTEFDAGGGVFLLNFTKRPLGIDKPPVCDACAIRSGSVIYQASDGWRVMQGTNSTLLDPADRLELLYSTDITRQEGLVNPVRRGFDNAVYTACIFHRDRLYISTELQNVGRILHIWDFTQQYWMQQNNVMHPQWNTYSMHLEEDGTILFGTDQDGDRNLREMSRVNKLNDNSETQIFKFRTVADNLGMPSQRKDTFSLQIEADTGSDLIAGMVRAYYDAGSPMDLTLPVYSFNGKTIRSYNLAALSNGGKTPPKRLALYLTTNLGVANFRLYNVTFEVDPRPIQHSFLRVPNNNFGVQGRKRLFELPFVMDTLNSPVSVNPVLDGIVVGAVNFTSNVKTTFNYLLSTSMDVTARDIGFELQALDDRVFEFYEMVAPREIEVLPDAILFKYVNYNNLGTTSRKRFIQYAHVIDTRGKNVTFTPLIDGVAFPSEVWNTTRKDTVIYTFFGETVGVDLGGTLVSLESTPFEDYGVNLEQCISEKLPPIARHYHLPYTNLGTASRKRFIQFALVIDTRGADVIFTPKVDGVSYPTETWNTNRKQTKIYTFATGVTGIDIGGILQSVGLVPFEYYGPNLDETISEKLPAAAQFRQITSTNFGNANKKRIRMIPFVIDTRGSDVIFKPTVDCVEYPPTTFNTDCKRTVLHYFQEDVFGIDFGGSLAGSQDFEFYEMVPPLNVETLPLGRKWDQVGPFDLGRATKLYWLYIRALTEGSAMTVTIFVEETDIKYEVTVQTFPGKDTQYSVRLPHFVVGKVFRVELKSHDVFHRWSVKVQHSVQGATENKILTLNSQVYT